MCIDDAFPTSTCANRHCTHIRWVCVLCGHHFLRCFGRTCASPTCSFETPSPWHRRLSSSRLRRLTNHAVTQSVFALRLPLSWEEHHVCDRSVVGVVNGCVARSWPHAVSSRHRSRPRESLQRACTSPVKLVVSTQLLSKRKRYKDPCHDLRIGRHVAARALGLGLSST